MRIFLSCGEQRTEFFRDVLKGDFAVEDLGPETRSEPGPGDLVLVDLAESSTDWRARMRDLRCTLGEGVKLVAVLRFGQIRDLDHRVPLDDFISDDSTGVEIRARLRRQAEEEKETAAGWGELEIDVDRYQVSVDGAPVELTFKEFELLRFLASHPGKVFTREVLLEQVWGYEYFGGSRTVDVHVRRIRSKLEREGRTYIRTVRGVGYMFEHAPRRR